MTFRNLMMHAAPAMIMFAIGLTIGFTANPKRQMQPELNASTFELCNARGNLTYCFGLQTDTQTLKEKCEDTTYLSQWNLTCSWLNRTCTCSITRNGV